jgi:methylisocitrate lyase
LPKLLLALTSWFSYQKSSQMAAIQSSKSRSSAQRSASPGQRFRKALSLENPLQIAGVIHAYAAILAEASGFKAIYLSGAGVANASYGVPDIGITRLEDVLIDVRRISRATNLPLLVDADTGWGDPAKTVREMIKAGAAAIHLEDQVEAKRCGHLAGKQLISTKAMVARIQKAVRGKTDPNFVVMARTDAVASEGLNRGITRAIAYRDAGADMIFAEALTDSKQYRQFAEAVKIPVLANITEFGKTPLYSTRELAEAGIRLALYPLSAFRAMNTAALKVFQDLRKHGTQNASLDSMQSRADLYRYLGYDPVTGTWKKP